jgi:aminoglycoside phosphotransferase (APT) family kinase protein
MPAKPIDEADLQRRADDVLTERFPGCTVEPIRPLQGGSSSITFWTNFVIKDGDAQKVVLKVAPAGLEPTRNRDVLRQARLQLALEDTAVPVPRVLGQHLGDPPDVPPFFVMSFEAGDCVEPNSLPPGTIGADEVRARELHAARILGALHTTDPETVGLGDEPEGGLEAEVQRWVDAFAACDEDLREGTDGIAEKLAETAPTRGRTTLIHGDFRLGNTLSRADRVESVIDWEIWSRGDARIDLAWFLMMANPDPALGRPTAAGMPPNTELLSAYEESAGAAVQDLQWFNALVRYKQAAAGAFIIRNARRRGQEGGSAAQNQGLLTSARQLLSMGQ